jgi:LytS/YehU family sensor histidine kinase
MDLVRRYGRPLALFALFTAVGLLFFGYHYLDDLARGQGGTLVRRLIEELTGSYTALVLLPFVLWFVRRFAWPWQILGALVFSAGHTTLMAITRGIIFPALGQGTYDYGVMRFRYPMEASNDIIVYAVIAGFVYFFDRTQRARERELASANLERELAEAKLENLRLQLHPHFLFNTLNAVSAVMYEDVRKADTMLARLSDFLRVVLSTSETREITLDEELQIDRMYVEIMQARLENGLEFAVNADPDARLAKVPALLLQPLIENAIRHGMSGGRKQLRISISAVRRGGAVEVRVCDDGNGLACDPPSAGHGLTNVTSRLLHLHGEQASVKIAQLEPHGTEVCLQFPLHA